MTATSHSRRSNPADDMRSLEITDGELFYGEGIFSHEESAHYLTTLMTTTPWREDSIVLYGKRHLIPRLQAWCADAQEVLHYSGLSIPPMMWTSELIAIRARVAEFCGIQFNSVLLNYYRDGRDSVGWHSDDEAQWGDNPSIASVSFGTTRDFILKHRFNKHLNSIKLPLSNGSVLLMGDNIQTHWKHQLPKRVRCTEPRINLTFRNIE